MYKPVGMTSHDVIAVLRRMTGIRQIGHGGTLDPFAEGVLPVCIGKATRLIEFLPDDKEYLATIQFGAFSTTYDIEGEKTFVSDKEISEAEIVENLKFFEGEIEQFPPIYSAIKVKGKKLYEYARKGEKIEIKPRNVFVEKISLKSYDKDNKQAQILVKCSKGTYIRSIANDLGKKLNCGGYLVKLVRTQSGKFRIEDSISLDDNIEKNIINPVEILDLPIIEIESCDLDRVKNGNSLLLKCKNSVSQNVLLVYNHDKICAVGQVERGIIKLKKVFL